MILGKLIGKGGPYLLPDKSQALSVCLLCPLFLSCLGDDAFISLEVASLLVGSQAWDFKRT